MEYTLAVDQRDYQQGLRGPGALACLLSSFLKQERNACCVSMPSPFCRPGGSSMHVLGDYHVNFVDKGDGTVQATVWFIPSGSSPPFAIGGPYDMAAGLTIEIGPSCC